MKTLLIFTLLVSTVIANAAPITLCSYDLPDDWPASDFSHTIGSPTGMPYVPYSFAAILTKEEVEKMGSLFSTSTGSTIKMPNGSTLKFEPNSEHKPQFADDIGIIFSIEGPGHEKTKLSNQFIKRNGSCSKVYEDRDSEPHIYSFPNKINANNAIHRMATRVMPPAWARSSPGRSHATGSHR